MNDQPNPFFVDGAPQGLLDQINERRARTPQGMRMQLSAEAAEGTDAGAESPKDGEAGDPQDAGPETLTPPAADAKDLSKLPQWAQTLVSDLRKEAGDARTNAKASAADEARASLAKDVAKALGLAPDEKVDPEKLAEQVAAAQGETAAVKRELAVYRLAAANGGDPDALLDSNSFMKSLAGLAPEETDKIGSAIKDAIQKNPKLSSGPRAGTRSGGDTGGSGERPVTQEAFDKMSGAERNKLYNTDPDLYARLSAGSKL